MKLWLDDERKPPSEAWVWVDEALKAIDLLDLGNVEEVSLDHDLGDDRWNGYVVACYIERRAHQGYPPPKWAVHSANPVGRQNIEAALKSAERAYAKRQKGTDSEVPSTEVVRGGWGSGDAENG